MYIYLIMIILLKCTRSDYFSQYEEYMLNEKGRQATSVLESHLIGAEDHPKEIEIVCKENPEVFIRDMSSEDPPENNECMVLKVKGPQFTFQLSLSCEDTKGAKFQFENKDL